MPGTAPVTSVDPRYSEPDAPATSWEEARGHLADAEVYWLSTVRPDGRPHVTPLIAVWLEDRLWFCTGPDERKALNLAANDAVVVTTGCNALGEGLDVVVEGRAARIRDDAALAHAAESYEAKYGPDWRFEVRDGAFVNEVGGPALVFAVAPSTVFGFRKGAYSQTRWRFTGP